MSFDDEMLVESSFIQMFACLFSWTFLVVHSLFLSCQCCAISLMISLLSQLLHQSIISGSLEILLREIPLKELGITLVEKKVQANLNGNGKIRKLGLYD